MIEQLLNDNRIEMTIEYDFRGILCWTVALWQYPIGMSAKEVFRDQFYSYAEMRKAIVEFLIKENNNGL